jgi:hypothetical protein
LRIYSLIALRIAKWYKREPTGCTTSLNATLQYSGLFYFVQIMTENIIQLLQHTDPASRELGFFLALGQGGVELLNGCIASGGGNLNMSGMGIIELPNGLIVGGWLDLQGCTALQSLPDGLVVGGWLDLHGCTALQSLPNGLFVGGWLYLRGCTALQSLPDGLVVGGWLDLQGCTALQSLPDGLKGKIYKRWCK